tara:strand:+ start:155 stop:1123 length:969 start_codon:yes stop_codon:yes gene_type:complete
MKINKPKFWDYKKPNIFAILLLPFTLIIRINILFQYFKTNLINKNSNLNIKTICIGNIYVGGTGKTPSAIKIKQILKKINYNSVFIKKNHSESYDEQRLLEKYGEVISLSKRTDSLNIINSKFDVAIFDDGLQDNSINYDLKIVCFNNKNFIGNGLLIPSGPLREKIDSLKKYDAVFINGNNEDANETLSTIKKYNKEINVFESSYTFLNLDEFDTKNNYIAFSGIGIPMNFIASLKKNKINIVKFFEFPDHYIYKNKDIEKIKNTAKILNAKIITTEKDYSRLENNQNNLLKEDIQFIKMELSFKDEDKLINFIRKKICDK